MTAAELIAAGARQLEIMNCEHLSGSDTDVAGWHMLELQRPDRHALFFCCSECKQWSIDQLPKVQ